MAAAYPPDDHVLRDMRFVTERSEDGSCTQLEVVPQLLTPAGSLHAGALATLVDLAGGEEAVRAAVPGWVATSDLVLHVMRPVRDSVVQARPTLLRRSRATAVVEVELCVREAPVGFATMTFAILEARSDMNTQRMGTGATEPRTEFGRPGSGLARPLAELLSVSSAEAGGGVVEIPITPYVGNSLGALQGGVVVMAVEFAALGLARQRLGQEAVALDLAVNYLSLVRRGPARTGARVLREDRKRGELLARIEVRDAGNDDRLCTVATVLLRAVS